MNMSLPSRAYIAFVCTLGLACLLSADWQMQHPLRFACYLLICMVASALKVNLPGILGTMSVNFLFILIGILDLGAGQTMLIGCVGALVQCIWKPKSRIRPVQAGFQRHEYRGGRVRGLLSLPLAFRAAAERTGHRCC